MVIVYGAGKASQGVIRLLQLMNKEFIIMDDKKQEDGIVPFSAELCQQATEIIITPGLPPRHELMKNFAEKVISHLQFCGRILQERDLRKNLTIIGITGTKGKSTTTWMTYRLLEKVLVGKAEVVICGNFGTGIADAVADLLEEQEPIAHHVLVVECSSFMLYQMSDFTFDYGIRTNFGPDHLDRHSDLHDYFNAKAELITHTTKKIFLHKSLKNHLEHFNFPLPEHISWYESSFDISHSQFLGSHNSANATAAIALTQEIATQFSVFIDLEKWGNSFSEIEPLPHRLQFVKEIEGVRIYDDNMCTNTEAQRVALESFHEKVVLITGGSSKGEEFRKMEDLYREKVGCAIVYGAMQPHLSAVFEKSQVATQVAISVDQALRFALQQAKENGYKVVLFSPGCASFDMFENYYKRAEAFEKALMELS